MEGHADEQLIAAIREGGAERQRAIRSIYHLEGLREKVIHYVQQNSGNFQDGQDVFHEGIIVLDRNIREGKFRGDSTLSLYLYAICRFLWMNQLRRKARVELSEDPMPEEEAGPENPEVDLLSDERKAVLQQLLDQLSDQCRQVLGLWQLSYSMQEIAARLGFSSEKMARKAKYRCQQALIKLVKSHPRWEEMIRW